MIEWSETDLLIRDAIRDFVDKEIRPRLDELEHGDLPPYDLIRKFFRAFGVAEMAKDTFAKANARTKAREQREDGPALEGSAKGKKPRSGGGLDSPGQETMVLLAASELSRVSMGLVTALGVSIGLAANTIMARGTAEQQQRWALDLLTFEKVGAWAITEPDAGSDAFGGMRTTVRPDGEGGYVLSGHKTFITNGPYADTLVVYAKLDDGSGIDRRRQPVLTFVLDSGMEGLTQSKPLRKMGLHGSPTGELFFDQVRLGGDRLLGGGRAKGGKSEDGRDSARSNFTMERIGVGALALGVIEECLRLSVAYAKQRELWGKQIGDYQLVQLKLAQMEIARINVTNMLFRTIELARSGRLPSLTEASAIKFYCSQAATDVAMEAVQLFGGNGYMSEYRVEQLARDAKSLMIYAGSNEIQITHVAHGLLTD